ncbi:hypothetical protein GCM10008904_07030 [Paraclostridium ghonii]|uniref:DUF4179 domain-containing protein n=1 Tax=Paraclostridium ghonii TaxID=29358 RepID=A0ABU0N395_9FIRM|nr:DUF4179 domain-containing protein [Paeniclostridium ghonii]MDQ0557439.1 hypothetical protein [Paeniclostridium ghonii]
MKVNNKKDNKKSKYVTGLKVASVAVLSVGVLGTTGIGQKAFANVNDFFYDIPSYLGINKNLDDYKKVVGESITKDGVTVSLNEVVVDKDQLIVTQTIKSKDKIQDGYASPNTKIFINGKEVKSDGGGGAERIDDNTVELFMYYKLDEKLTGDIDVKMEISSINFMKGEKEEAKQGSWTFEFKTNAKIVEDTKEAKLDSSFKLENGQTIKLDKFTSNNLGKEIEFSKDSNANDYDIVLRGKDNLGNNVEFMMGDNYEYNGNFIISDNGDINENAKELKLTAYAEKFSEDGRMKGDYQKVSDEFTIKLPK